MWMFGHQCGCRTDGCFHRAEHCAGEDEIRGSGGPLPDRQDAENSETRHGADRGTARAETGLYRSSSGQGSK